MKKHLTKLLAVLAVLVAAPLSAQTPEGTVITNQVSATYKDANGNSYTATPASVSVTVGFQSGIDVTGSPLATPTSPSDPGNLPTLDFVINNIGNGVDTVQVSTSIESNDPGFTIVGYHLNGDDSDTLTLGELNALLADLELAGVTGSATVTVMYSVALGQGGKSIDLSLTATSVRDAGESDTHATPLEPPVSGTVTVTAVVPNASKLPGATSTTFTVQNNTSTSLNFTLGTTVAGSLSGVSIVGGTAVTIGANSQTTVTVNYTVGASGSGSITLSASATSGPTTYSDDDVHNVTIVTPVITLTKTVFDALNGNAINPGTLVVPGQTVWYRLTISNTGTAPAREIAITDVLPSQVTFVSLNPATITGWVLSETGGTISINSNTTPTVTTLNVGSTLTIWVAVTIN